MDGRLLIGYEETEAGQDALALGKLIADACDAGLVVAGVEAKGRQSARLADELNRAAAAVDGRVETTVGGSAARALKELGERIGADLIVIGSSRHGEIGRVKLGRTGRGLVLGGPCAVSISPAGFRESEPALRVVGVGFDGSNESKDALAAAVALGQATKATLRVFTVVDPPALGPGRAYGYPSRDYMSDLRDYFRERLDGAVASVPTELRPSGQLLKGRAAEALAEEASKGVDILCVGSRSHGPVRRVLLGSVSRKLADLAACPMLVVPRGAMEARPGGRPVSFQKA